MNRIKLVQDNAKFLITGVTSIHGWPVYKRLASLFSEDRILAVGTPKLKNTNGYNIHPVCITDREKLEALAKPFGPTHVIHCGGVCDLDVCEARPEWAKRMNKGGAEVIRDLFSESCHITYVGSDLVFSGTEPPFGGYNEDHEPDPISVVGRSYLDAERIISSCENNCIIRIGLPLGESFTGDKGAIDWIESRFKRSLPVTLFHDECRSCISCDELADKILNIVFAGVNDLFHCGGSQSLSLYDIGHLVLDSGNYAAELLKMDSRLNEINGPPRVGDVSLNSSKLEKFLLEYNFINYLYQYD